MMTLWRLTMSHYPMFPWAYAHLCCHVSVRRIGGITFVRLGRFGFSYWRSR